MRKYLIMLALPLFFFIQAGIADAETSISRLAGKDRFEVAVNVSKNGWSSSSTVVLSFYNAYADALSAAPLAKKNNAPILLTHKDYLTTVTKNEINRLNASKVILVGGTGSISNNVVEDLKKMGIFNIQRYGGKDRFEVAKNIANEFNSSKAIVAYGLNFSDALAIAPYAAENGFPILLTRKDSIPDETAQALQMSSITNTLVIGGEGSVSNAVYSKLKSPQRIGGKDRFEVAANIVKQLGYNTNKAYLATGLTFADALTGSVLAANNGAPILLAHPNSAPSSIQSVIFDKSMFNITVLGGTASVPQSIVEKLISYRLATIDSKGNLSINPTNYNSISQVPLKTSNQVAVFGNEIVRMLGGMAVGDPSYGKSTVYVYNSTALSGTLTYVSPGAEMKYIEADAEKVKVQVADKVGWVKQSEVALTPTVVMNNSRTYYTANSARDLVHVVNNYGTVIGKAPGFIATGQNYYSWDGYTFFNASNQQVGTQKQYFQFKTIVSKTAYTKEQFLDYINNSPDTSISTWEAKEGRPSPLRDPNLIQAFLNAQETYGINGLFILSAAIHESAWGVSDIATATNNLFGIKAYDSDPAKSAEKFNSFVESINAFAGHYMKNEYTNQNNWKYNGSYPGNKGAGINVRYASDPFWGSRVAAHMYKIDKYLGSQEINK